MRVVIIGAGQAGAAAAAKLRNLGHAGEIVVIGGESAPPYQRPPLSKAYLKGEIGAERLWLRSADFWQDQSISLRLGQSVDQIDASARQLQIGGEPLSYDALILATGAAPRRLPAALGGDLAGVHVMRDLADADALRADLRPGARLVILGGGYIGLEAAAVARAKGLEVTLLEAAPRILQRVAAPETADAMRALHQSHGVDIREATGVARLVGHSRVEAVELATGEILPADLVVLGIGVTPRTALAEAAGLTCDNGIATDAQGRTSDPAIWAAGDCASFPYLGGRIRLESVGNAIDQAEAVAANILGADKPYLAKPWFWSDQYDMKLQIAGLNHGYDRVVTRQEPAGAPSFWYYRGATLLAVDALGDARAFMVAKRLIESHRSPLPVEVENAPDLKALLN